MADSTTSQAALHNEILLAGFGDRDAVWPFGLGLLFALVVHGSLGATTTLAPTRKLEERVEMAIYHPPPPPPPETPPPPPPEPEKPKPKPKEPPPPLPETPPPPNQEPPPETPKEPVPIVTGISMASTVQGNTGFAVRVGNTTFGDPNKEQFVDPKDIKPYAGGSTDFKAARASTITREARVIKDYKGPYPRDLADQGIEGAAVLLIEIAKNGDVRSVRLVKTCGNATLDKLAVEYVKRVRFAPAEVDGAAVDSVLRYTYRFELYD
ncbi:MAG: energy transducer TonB [Deltaproteobacteria bacterium]|nr:energy transducer TonB [Deltaproteobacteria bacterium]